MITKELLKQVIYDQRHIKSGETISRDIDLSVFKSNEISVISGIRRCGKSVLMHQLCDMFTEHDYFINFDDDRLMHFSLEDFTLLHEVFIEEFGVQHTFYFDEIQLIPGWERFADRIYTSGNKVIVTGSNAYMLSRELGTLLTGRHLTQQLYPFSFNEFLRCKGVEVDKQDLYVTENRVQLLQKQREFMQSGGFPQYVTSNNPRILRELYNDIMYRDIIVRHHLPSERPIRELGYYLASNNTHRFTFSSLSKAINIKSVDTVKDYLSYFEETYLIGIITKYSHKVGEQLKSPRKAYFIDTGLASQIGFNLSDNIGKKLENAVYVELLRRGHDIYYYDDGPECDFITRQGSTVIAAYQVCASMNQPETVGRELDGLISAMNAFGLQEGYIITLDQYEERKHTDGRYIHIIPFYRWVLFNV